VAARRFRNRESIGAAAIHIPNTESFAIRETNSGGQTISGNETVAGNEASLKAIAAKDYVVANEDKDAMR
jgi:hypothetical protein